MTRFQCLKRKLGMEKFKPNAATEHGKALEPKVREMMEVRLGEKLDELVLQSRKHPHLVAQIDGLGENHQIEIKCPYRESSFIEMVKKIPEHYEVQMQHQMLVTGKEEALFVFYYKGHLLQHPLFACRETQDMIVAETLQFVEDLQTAREANRK